MSKTFDFLSPPLARLRFSWCSVGGLAVRGCHRDCLFLHLHCGTENLYREAWRHRLPPSLIFSIHIDSRSIGGVIRGSASFGYTIFGPGGLGARLAARVLLFGQGGRNRGSARSSISSAPGLLQKRPVNEGTLIWVWLWECGGAAPPAHSASSFCRGGGIRSSPSAPSNGDSLLVPWPDGGVGSSRSCHRAGTIFSHQSSCHRAGRSYGTTRRWACQLMAVGAYQC